MIKDIKPQDGYQVAALQSPADIVIGGGAAGVGKTFTLLLEPIRYAHVRGFGGVIFRRTSPQIRAEGGLWDASEKLYNQISGTVGTRSSLEWSLSPYTKLKFSHLEYEKNVYDWQGSEIPFIGFDELTHFSRNMFFYLLSRNRSTCGVRPYVRATCNPDPDSWVANFIDWYIDDEGFPIKERAGVLRYFMVDNNNYIWGDTKDEVVKKGWHVLEPLVKESGINPRRFIKSLTFIGGNIYQNVELLKTNPEYLGNLNAQSEDEKARLLLGNWKRRTDNKDLFNFDRFRNIFTNSYVEAESKYKTVHITTDIAMKGSDKMVVFCWRGKMLIDFEILPKTKGNEVINAIRKMAVRHRVQYTDIAFDNDGVGQFVDGFIDGAKEFNNGSRPVGGENYKDLKSQCFYKAADAVERGEYYIPPEVANKPYDEKQTLKERLLFERKAIKRAKPDHEGKLAVIPKNEQKPFLNGQSPDVIETFMMLEIFDLTPEEPEVFYS